MRTVGERIKHKREQLKLSQDDLAQKLGYKSRSSINKIELGERNLTQSKIKAIADALDTTPGYIMGWEDPTDLGMPPENDPDVIKEAAEVMNIYLHLKDREIQKDLLQFARRMSQLNEV